MVKYAEKLSGNGRMTIFIILKTKLTPEVILTMPWGIHVYDHCSQIISRVNVYRTIGPLVLHPLTIVDCLSFFEKRMSRIVRKPDFCLCEIKGTDQLCSNS